MYNPTAHLFLRRCLAGILAGADAKKTTLFENRLYALFNDIFERFEKLYGSNEDFEAHLEALIGTMLRNYAARPIALKKSDAQREASPGWFRSEQTTGMMLYADRFNKDLNGLIDKIDYLEELGINLVHLMPVLESPKEKNDGGYAVSNYRKIDARFGTNKDFKKVAKTLHDKDMLLMIDIVVNHTSDEHEWALKAQSGDKAYQDYYYTFPDRTIPELFERGLPEVFPETAPGNFTFDEAMQKWVMTVFNNYQWDLNYTNPRVFIEMLDVVLFLANMGVDIFRMDAVAFVWKKMGTASQNLPEAHTIHQLFKLCTQVVAPGVAFLAEAIVAPEEIVKYFGESKVWSNEHDIAYNATLMALLWNSVATHSTKVMQLGLRDLPQKPEGTTWINYIRCHDDIGLGFEDRHISEAGFDPYMHRRFLTRFLTGKFEGTFAKGLPFMYNPKNGDARISGSLASLAGLEEALESGNRLAVTRAVGRINMLHSVVLSYGGIPMVYYGDELATLNDYGFADDPAHSDDNRWVHRPVINWDEAAKRTKKGQPIQAVFAALQRMIAVRRESPELADSNNLELADLDNEHIFAYLREKDDLLTLCVHNFKDTDQFIDAHAVFPKLRLQHDRLFDKVSGKEIQQEAGRLILKPYQYYWLTNTQ
ncbi:MAG: alpha-amylase family glycosyl hydrolase [Roseivirga sp.]